MRGRPRPGGVSWGPPPPTPVCLRRRETGLTREPYRAVCLAVRSVCAGRGRRRLRRCLARADAADAEYNVDRVYLHVPAKKSVLVAPSFGRLDLPNSFLPFFSGLQRKDDRCTTLVERPHPYEACRPLAFSLHWWQGATDLEVLDIRRRRVVRRVTLLNAGEQQGEPEEARREQQREPGEARREPGTGRTNHRHAVKYIHHDLERNELVMMSVQTEEALASVIVFRLQPLEFLVHFQVLRRNFPHADTLTVGEGVVMMTSRSRGIVSLYSLDTILQERSFVAGLGDEVTVKGRRYVIGQRPHGLPINGQLPAAAPPIATFPAYQGFLELGASPYHIVTRRKQSEGFEVRAMLDGALVLTTEALQSSVGAEAATFVDDGPFLVQHSTSELRVFDLRSGQTVLQVDPASFSSWSLPAPSGPITTRSGRRVRLRSAAVDCLSALAGSDWWLAWDIEDELDLLVVVVVEEEVGETAILRRLLLYDRQTWTLTSDTPLEHRMSLSGAGLAQVSVVMDRCLLFVKLRSSAAKCTTLVYSLTAAGGLDERQSHGSGPDEPPVHEPTPPRAVRSARRRAR